MDCRRGLLKCRHYEREESFARSLLHEMNVLKRPLQFLPRTFYVLSAYEAK